MDKVRLDYKDNVTKPTKGGSVSLFLGKEIPSKGESEKLWDCLSAGISKPTFQTLP